MNYLELSKIPFSKFKEKAIISLIEHEENIKECIGYLLNYDYSFDKIIIVSKNIKVNK